MCILCVVRIHLVVVHCGVGRSVGGLNSGRRIIVLSRVCCSGVCVS